MLQNTELKKLEELEELFEGLQIPEFDQLIKLYSGNYDFTEDQILVLLQNLNYLISGKFEEVLTVAKFMRIEDKEIENIDERLFDIYHIIKLHDTLTETAISYGYLDLAKWSLPRENCNIQMTFRLACSKGHLQTAQWLYSLGNVDIHAENEYAFRFACSNGHLEVAQWLYSLGGVNIHAEDDQAFRFTRRDRRDDHLELAQWLDSL